MKFKELAEYFEKLGATTKRLELTDILSQLFKKAKETNAKQTEVMGRAHDGGSPASSCLDWVANGGSADERAD